MAIKSFTRSTIENNIFYRSMLAGNTAYSPSTDEDVLAEEILTSSLASVTFSGLDTLAAAYKHLQIRYVARTNRAVSFFDIIAMEVNADGTSGNYKWHSLVGDTTSVNSYSGSLSSGGLLAGDAASNNSIANAFSANVVDILDPFDSSKNLTTRTLVASPIATGLDQQVALYSSLWLNTNAVTSLTLKPNSGSSFVQYSSFTLIGVK